MKKLMIAACAAAMAMGANAATDTWTFAASYMPDELEGNPSLAVKDGYNGTEVGVYSGAKAVGTGFTAYYFTMNKSLRESVADLNVFLGSMRAGKSVSDAIAESSIKLLATANTDENGYLEKVTADVDTSYYNGGLLLIFTMIAGKDAEDHVFFYSAIIASDVRAAVAAAGYTNNLRDNDGTKNFVNGLSGWYSTVPEPTSGLLMLMGGMLLGLRRKRV